MQRIRSIVAGAAVLLACDVPVSPSGTGGLSLSAASSAANCGQLTDGRVQVRGPTKLTVSIAPGTTKTISDLTPGTYTARNGIQLLVPFTRDRAPVRRAIQTLKEASTKDDPLHLALAPVERAELVTPERFAESENVQRLIGITDRRNPWNVAGCHELFRIRSGLGPH